MRSNIKYLFSELRKNDPMLLVWQFFMALISVALPLSVTVFSSELVRIVTQRVSAPEFFGVILFFSAFTAALYLLQIAGGNVLGAKNFAMQMRAKKKCLDKQMKIDYVTLESGDGANTAARAFSSVGSLQGFADEGRGIFASLLGFFSYGAVISMLHPIIALLIAAMTVVHYFLVRRLAALDFSDREKSAPLERKIDYLISKCRDFNFAKEIRLLAIKDFLLGQFGVLLGKRLEIFKKQQNRHFGVQMIVALMSFIESALVYAYLIFETVNGRIDAARFVLYLGTITGFSGWIIQIIEKYGNLTKKSLEISDLRKFLEYGDQEVHHGKLFPDRAPKIEIKNVGFSYTPEKKVLCGLDMTINPGERVALVGLNGAGKTTLVKLLCGLYTPGEGQILFDGQKEISPDDFSVVFQDIYLLPVSIAENISLCDNTDNEKLQNALRLSGMDEVCAKLPDGQNTLLVKELSENAVELSGGERQKLAVARALYKDGSIMILDEPTAALDPISEDAIYRKFGEMTEGKTSIFISHRLASTRFCDRIFLLKDGVIAECGTHDCLMELGGEYAHLFETQSKYYSDKKEAEE